MKNSLFKRAFAAVAAVPLALTQCLTYSSYAVTNDSTQTSVEDTSDSTDKTTYTLDNLLYIAPDQVESSWYADIYAELIEMGSKKSTGYIQTEKIVDSILSYAGKYKSTAEELVKVLEDDMMYSVATNGDIKITGSIGNPDLSFLTKDAQDAIDKKFNELKEEYEAAKKEVSESLGIPEEEFETLNVNKEELAAKYGVSLEDLEKYNINIEDIAAKLEVPVENFDGVETIDDIEVPKFDFSSVDFSGTYEIVIEGSDLKDGNKFDVKAKYTANQAVNGKIVFAVGDCADFALAKIKDIRACADKTIADIAQYDAKSAEEAQKKFDAKFNSYTTKINKAKSKFDKVYTVERSAKAGNMAELIQKINNFADKNSYVDKLENKLNKEFKLPSSAAEIASKSIVANIYDDLLGQLNDAVVSYDVQIKSSELAAFADNELFNLTAESAGGTYTLKGDFPDAEVADSLKHLVASVEAGNIYDADATLATVGLKIYREPIVTTTTTTSTTTTTTTTTDSTSTSDSSTTTTTDSTSTSDSSTSTTTTDSTSTSDSSTTTTTDSTSTSDSSTSTTTTDSTSTSDSSTSTTTTDSTSTSDSSTSTTTTDSTSTNDSSSTTTTDSTTTSSDSSTTSTTTTTDGIVLNGEVKSWSVAADAEGYGFYYSIEEEFHKEQVEKLVLNVVYADDTEAEYDITNNFGFEATPSEKFSKYNTTFKYNVALTYEGEDITDKTGKVVFKSGDILKTYEGYNVTVVAYIGVKGDINLDNLADSVDATQARIYYAKISAGTVSGAFTAKNTQLSLTNSIVDGPTSIYDDFAAFLGDVNQNGAEVANNWKASKSDRLIDSVDATGISMYYALISAHGDAYTESAAWDKVLSGK